ncbi:MAG: DnrO protein [Rudaea sp.]
MKRMGFALVSLGALVFAPCAVASPPQAHSHTHEHATTSTPVPAVRWATDAALREGMHRVHGALDQLHRYELGQLPQSAALASVADIEAAGAYMFANCKLDPTPDAALHGMLAPLLAGAAALKQNPKDMTAVAAMRNAVADYPRYFDDPAYAEDVGEALHKL